MGGRRSQRQQTVALGCLAMGALAAALLAFATPAGADATLVPAGSLTSNEAWSAGGSPYQLVGTLKVPSGITLSMNPGTVVQFNTSSTIIVEGSLNITGSSSQNVVLGPNGFTPCLQVNSSGSVRIRYAVFERCNEALVVRGGAADVANTRFNNTVLTAVSVVGNSGPVLISNSQIDGGLRGIYASGGRARLTATDLTVSYASYCLGVSGASDVSVRRATFVCSSTAIDLGGASWINISEVLVNAGTLSISTNQVDHLNFSANSIPVLGRDQLESAILAGLGNSTLGGNTWSVNPRLPEEGVPPSPPRWAVQVRSPSGPNAISGNTIRNYEFGLIIDRASSTQTITGNSFVGGNETGLWLKDTTGAVISGNQWTGKRFPFEVSTTGIDLPQFYRHNVSISNMVDGRPILYLLDANGLSLDLDGGAGIIALVGARNVSLSGGTLEKGLPSLLVVDSADVAVSGTDVLSWWRAVEVIRSQRVVLDNITAHGNLTCFSFRDGAANVLRSSGATECVHGLIVEGSEQDFQAERLVALPNASVSFFEGQNLTLRDSQVQDCQEYGVSDAKYPLPRDSLDWPAIVQPVYGTPSGITLSNVSIGNCPTALSFRSVTGLLSFRALQVVQTSLGAHLQDVEALWVNGSSFSARSQGIHAERVGSGTIETSTFAGTSGTGLSCSDCNNLTVRENLFLSNGQGVGFIRGAGGMFTRNEFYGNTAPASTDTEAHSWDDGAVGNLWDSYTGIDADGDGIGETPFVVSSGAWGTAQDNFPIAFRPDNVPPVANAGPDQTVDEDIRVYFTGYLSTDDFMVRVHLWTFVDGNQTVTLAGVTTWYVFTDPGRYTVTLTVIDWGGNRDTDTLIVTVRDKTGPVANAGGDRTVDEDVPVLLDGTASTDNDRDFPAGAIYRWQVYDRQGLSTLLSPRVNWTFAIPGRYLVTLEVRDAAGNVGQDRAWITVRDTTPPTVPPLTPPVAEEDFPFSVYSSLVTDNDPDWPDGRVEWFELWSHGSIFARSDDSPGRFQVETPGTYTAFYYVVDASGNIGRGNVTFRVKDVTPPDLSLYGPRSEEAGTVITFDLSFALDNDPDFPAGATATWTVRLPSGNVVIDGATATYSFQVVGEFLVTLRAWDADGNQAQTQFQVKIEDTRGPTIRIEGPALVEAGSPVSFFANVSDPSGATEVSWRVSGQQFPIAGVYLNYAFARPGTYTLTAFVSDTYGNMANASSSLVVADTTAPSAVIAITPTPQGDVVHLLVNATLSAASIGSDAVGIANITWGWDDGSISWGQTADHAWSQPGEYVVVVHVVDAAGNVNMSSFRVIVEALPDGGGGGPDGGGGTSTPPVPTAEVLSPLSALLIVAGLAAGAFAGFMAARRLGPRKPAR